MRVIALLTDFGLSDNFVGVTKGVIARINPQAKCIDITHEVVRHDIFQAALILKASYKYFPKWTIFLVVVDPGVGSKRKPIIIRSKNYFFVGPDNGCLSLAANCDGIKEIVAIENKRYFLKPLSCTFHGRDIFAPAAAYLAQGKSLNTFGKTLDSIKCLKLPQPKVSKNILRGEVIYIDRFGNLVTNIEEDLFERISRNKRFKLKIKDVQIDSVAGAYQEVAPGEPLAIFGSFGFLEISVNQGSAQKRLCAKRGLALEIRLA